MTRHCVLYARVSTEDQLEGPSLQTQLDLCRRYAAEHGLIKVGEFSEDYTGTSLDRPQFQQALRVIEAGQANALVVAHQDRLSRNYIDFLILRDQLEKAGVELHFVSTGQSQKGFSGLLSETVMALLAHGERERFLERCKTGRDARSARGEIMSNNAPYGYRKVNRHLVIDEDQANVVRYIFALAAGTEEPPIPLRAIARRLNDSGIPPARGKHMWYASAVRHILKNEVYIGVFYWGKLRVIEKKRVLQSPEKWIKISVEPIISKELFNICQKRLQENKQLATRNRKREYLLSGFVRCGCDHAMAGRKFGRDLLHYECTTVSTRRMRAYYAHDDYHPAVHCEYVEERVLLFLHTLLNDEEYFRRIFKEAQDNRESYIQPKRDRLRFLEEQIDEHLKAIDRLVRRMGEIDDEDVAHSVAEQIKQHSANKVYLLEEKIKLEDALAQMGIPVMTEEYILTQLAEYRSKLSMATYDDLRYTMRLLNLQVIVTFSNDMPRHPNRPKIEASVVFNVPIDITDMSIVNSTACYTVHNMYQFTLVCDITQRGVPSYTCV